MPSKLDELRRDAIRAQVASPAIVIHGVGVGATSGQGQGNISGGGSDCEREPVGGQSRSWNNSLEPQTCSYLSRKMENLGARMCHRAQRVECVTRQNTFLQVSLAHTSEIRAVPILVQLTLRQPRDLFHCLHIRLYMRRYGRRLWYWQQQQSENMMNEPTT